MAPGEEKAAETDDSLYGWKTYALLATIVTVSVLAAAGRLTPIAVGNIIGAIAVFYALKFTFGAIRS